MILHRHIIFPPSRSVSVSWLFPGSIMSTWQNQIDRPGDVMGRNKKPRFLGDFQKKLKCWQGCRILAHSEELKPGNWTFWISFLRIDYVNVRTWGYNITNFRRSSIKSLLYWQPQSLRTKHQDGGQAKVLAWSLCAKAKRISVQFKFTKVIGCEWNRHELILVRSCLFHSSKGNN